MFYENRQDAGEKLAAKVLDEYGIGAFDLIVGLARGGVIIAAEVAKALQVPAASLSISHVITLSKEDGEHDGGVTRTYTHITGFETASTFRDMTQEDMIVDPYAIRTSSEQVQVMLDVVTDQHSRFGDLLPENVEGKRILVCDDGVVSGYSLRAAIDALTFAGASDIVVAVPVVPKWFPEKLKGHPIVYMRRSRMNHFKTGMFYNEFEDTPDQDVISALEASAPTPITG